MIIILTDCQNIQTNNNTNTKALPIKSLPQIDGFYIFKRNMTFQEISKLLLERKIHYKIISLDKQDEINCLRWRYSICANDLKDFKNIRILEGFNLSIFNNILNKFQICFFKDTIFYFSYEQNLEAEYIPNSVYKGDHKFTDAVNNDIALLKSLSNGLNHKYGYPARQDGELNAFYPSTSPFYHWNDNTHNGTSYVENQFWLSNDSLVHIMLQNVCIKDSSKLQPYIIKTQGISTIEVLFNRNFAKEIQLYGLGKNELLERAKKKSADSLLLDETKKFDSL